MKFRKIIVSLLLSVGLCMAMMLSVSAQDDLCEMNYDVEPAYEIADTASSLLGINSTTATCISKAYGTSATLISVTQTLEKHSGWFWIWNAVDGANWTSQESGNTIYVSNTKSGLTSGTYRLMSVFTLTKSNGQTETITVYSDEVTVA